jgi:nucleoside-diphosphate-sugar epimerase
VSNDPVGDLDAHWTNDVDPTDTVSFARAAKEAGVPRFLFASSCRMYGAGDLNELVTGERRSCR